MIPGILFLILIFCLGLIKSADLVVVAIRRLSRGTKSNAFAISSIILALGTSLPELFVGITSALEGNANLSLGVVVGSNISNVALIGSLAAFLVGTVRMSGSYYKEDIGLSFMAGILPIFLMLDGSISRVDALILLAVYLGYTTGFYKHRFVDIGNTLREEGFIYKFLRSIGQYNHIDGKKTREAGKLFLGIALLLFFADLIVKLSTQLATMANIPLFVVGLVIVAIGTSLPEFAFSLRSLKDREPSMFLGNLLGSTIVNSTLVVGVTALIKPIQIVALGEFTTSVVTFLLVFSLFWFFIRSKHSLNRWEAASLIFVYLVFVIVEFL